MTNHFKSARGSKIVMEGGDRQRGVIVGCNSGERTEKQKEKNKVKEQQETVKYGRGKSMQQKNDSQVLRKVTRRKVKSARNE